MGLSEIFSYILGNIKNFFNKKTIEVESINNEVVVEKEEVLKVIGVGGFGIRAVNYLKEKGFTENELFVMDTDAIDIKQSKVPYLQIGEKATRGIGSGTNSNIGKISAIENHNNISNVIEGATTVILLLSSGGATGTGAAPIIANIAKKNNATTIAIVTTSFILNGRRRNNEKNFCIDDLKKTADKVIVIAENKLVDLEKIDRKFSFTEVIKRTNEMVYRTIKRLMNMNKTLDLRSIQGI